MQQNDFYRSYIYYIIIIIFIYYTYLLSSTYTYAYIHKKLHENVSTGSGKAKLCFAVSALLGCFLSFVLSESSFPSFVYILHSKLYSLGVCGIVSVYDTESEGSRCWLSLGSSFCFPSTYFQSWLSGKL